MIVKYPKWKRPSKDHQVQLPAFLDSLIVLLHSEPCAVLVFSNTSWLNGR